MIFDSSVWIGFLNGNPGEKINLLQKRIKESLAVNILSAHISGNFAENQGR